MTMPLFLLDSTYGTYLVPVGKHQFGTSPADLPPAGTFNVQPWRTLYDFTYVSSDGRKRKGGGDE